MITPEQIRVKSLRKYTSFLQALIREETFTRIEISGDKSYTKSSLPDFEKEILSILSQSKEKKGYGYSLDFQKVKTKYLGTQDLPIGIYFDTETDFLKYLGREKEAERFKQNYQKLINEFPEVREWIIANPSKIIQNGDKWDNILKVCRYFQKTPTPKLYIRELPVQVHTKFIESNQTIIKELLNRIRPRKAGYKFISGACTFPSYWVGVDKDLSACATGSFRTHR